jgi:diacylglycerol kinase family enzyme
VSGVRKSVAGLFGVERVNNAEYGFAVFIRSLFDRPQRVEIHYQNQTEELRLLSGVVMNFPIAGLPFRPTVTVEHEAFCVYLVPQNGRVSSLMQIAAPKQRLEIRFADDDAVEFFLDEDPVTTYKKLTLSVAGSIAFVPGPDYQSVDEETM